MRFVFCLQNAVLSKWYILKELRIFFVKPEIMVSKTEKIPKCYAGIIRTAVLNMKLLVM